MASAPPPPSISKRRKARIRTFVPLLCIPQIIPRQSALRRSVSPFAFYRASVEHGGGWREERRKKESATVR